MRETLHLVTSADYLAYAGLFTSARAARIERELAKWPAEVNLEELISDLVRHAAQEPRSRPELLALLGRPKLTQAERRPWLEWQLLTAKGKLVHTPSGSVWRLTTGGSKFVPAAAWLGADGGEDDAARRHLVRRYLAGFGPATRADVAHWTGLSVARLEPALSDPSLRRFRDEHGRLLLDVARAPLPPASAATQVRLLPAFEGCLLAHADRTRIVSDEHRRLVIRGGDVRPTFLVHGFVAGTWTLADGEVELEPFDRVPHSARVALEREARILRAFIA
jgi:Winged helix DNA-binding domain